MQHMLLPVTFFSAITKTTLTLHIIIKFNCCSTKLYCKLYPLRVLVKNQCIEPANTKQPRNDLVLNITCNWLLICRTQILSALMFYFIEQAPSGIDNPLSHIRCENSPQVMPYIWDIAF